MGPRSGMSPEIRTFGCTLDAMVMPMPPSGSNSPDVNYPPPKPKYADPNEPAEPAAGYYKATDPPLRTRALRRLGRIVGGIRRSSGS